MKRIAVITSVLLFSCAQLYAGVLVMEGKYQRKNIYVVNSITNSGVGFCTYEVRVNGDVTADEINSNAFEIDLSQYQLEFGEDVIIEIKYKEDCVPKVVNPDVLKPRPTFETENIQVNDQGILSWHTTNEEGELPFIVQQFKWNKWVNVGEVEGKGKPELNRYAFKTTPISGENRFRVIQKSYEGKVKTSPVASFISMSPKVSLIFNKKKEKIEFSEETSYEVYNEYGQIAKRGYASFIDVSNLNKGLYYISYDSVTEEFRMR